MSEADRQLQSAPGFEDVKEEFLRLREVVPHHEFWARRIDVLAALRRHADEASSTTPLDSLSLAKRRDLLLDRDSELRYAFRLLVPHRMSEQQFWQRVLEAQKGGYATRSVAQQVADSAGGQPFSMDKARRHLALEAGRLADGKGLAVGGDNALPAVRGRGHCRTADARCAHPPPPSRRPAARLGRRGLRHPRPGLARLVAGATAPARQRERAGRAGKPGPRPICGGGHQKGAQGPRRAPASGALASRGEAGDLCHDHRPARYRLTPTPPLTPQINSYSASELDAMGTTMVTVGGGGGGGGGGEGSVNGQATGTGSSDAVGGESAPLQVSALTHMSSVDDASAAAREDATVQGVAVREGSGACPDTHCVP